MGPETRIQGRAESVFVNVRDRRCMCMCMCIYMCVVAMDIHMHNACSIHDRAHRRASYIFTQALTVVVVCTRRKKINQYCAYSPYHKIHSVMLEREYVCVCVRACVHVCACTCMYARIETGVRIKHVSKCVCVCVRVHVCMQG